MKISSYDEKQTSFLAHKTRQQLIERAFISPKIADYTAGGTAAGAADRFMGAIAIPGGAILVPYSAGVVGLLSSDGTYTDGPAAGGSARFRGGCLTDNDLVIFAPALQGNIGIYDLKTKLFRLGASVSNGTGTGPGFAGCCKLKNGMILLAPRGRNTVGLYNPLTDQYSEGPAHGLGDNAFSGCVPLQNGKALLIPYDGDFFMLYDYRTNTLEQGPASGGTAQYGGAVALSTGDVVCSPYSKNGVGIYRFATNTVYVKPDAALSAAAKFMGCCLTYDGRVLFVPYSHPNIMCYDPTNDTLVTTTAVSGATKFAGAAQLPNGKIALAPYSSANVGIVDTNAGAARSTALRCNMYFNSTI